MHKKSTYIFFLVISFMGIVSHAQNIIAPKSQTPVVSGYAYIQFAGAKFFDVTKITDTRTGNAEVDAYFDAIGVTKIASFDPNPNLDAISRAHGIDRMFTLEFSNREMTAREAADGLLRLKAVSSASPCFLFAHCYTPNDTHVGEQYALTKMNVLQAWNSTHGDTNVIIAVTDDGVNYNHEDLTANLALNRGEMGLDANGKDKRTNGKDDDGDGYKDNWRGWDFIGNGVGDSTRTWKPDNDPIPPKPSSSHGTHVAGCAAATTDNGKGLAGTGFNCRILPLKIGDSNNVLGAGYQGIQYAATHGARVINCSWGGTIDAQFIPFTQQLIDNVIAQGSLVVASAGNNSSDNDVNPFFPANLNGVLSVGATDQNDKAPGFSNFGKIVDVFAPGAGVFTTGVPDNDSYNANFGGTSASAPLASGVCGLLFTKYPEWTPKFVNRQLVETCDNVVNPANRTKYWGRINAGNAISMPSYPGLVIKTYSVDGVPEASLDFIHKKYTLSVKFRNVVSAGDVQAVLLPRAGYTVNTSTAQLGTMQTSAEKVGTFQFTRDGNDDGSTLHLFFYVVSGTKYKDTLRLDIPINGSDEWIDMAMHNSAIEGNSFGECYPNPASESVTLPITLSRSKELSVRVNDILGRSVYTRNAELFDAGAHQLSIDTRTFSKGMYYVTILLESGECYSAQLVIVK